VASCGRSGRRVVGRWRDGALLGLALVLARPAFVSAAPGAPSERSASPAVGEPLTLPSARNALPPVDAPQVLVTTKSVQVDGVEFELGPWLGAGEHVQFLHDLAFVLRNKRELWLYLNPGATFPGASALFVDAGTRGGLFKSVVYTLAAAGYPNVLLVVQNATGGLGTLPFDGRVPGLAAWKERSNATLSAELRSDGSVLLSQDPVLAHAEAAATLTLDELPAEVLRRWAALGAARATEPDAPDDRALLRFSNDTPYSTIVRLVDALSEAKQTHASDDGSSQWPAFMPTLGASERDLEEFRATRSRGTRPRRAERQRPRRPEVLANFDERVGYYFFGINAGARAVDFRSLDRALRADGFGTLPATLTPLGGTLDGGLWRWRTGVEFAFARTSTRNQFDGSKLNGSLFAVSLTLGYDILRFRRSTLFAATGIGGGDLSLWPRMPGVTWASTGLEPTRRDHVVYSYTLVPFELGFEHLVPVSRSSREGWGVSFGVRGGAGLRLGGNWHPEEGRDKFNGPRFDSSGLEGRLVLGIGGFVVRGQRSGD